MLLTITVLSILFQLAAAGFALKLIAITRRTTAWVLLAVAMALMAVRRIDSLIHILTTSPAGFDVLFEGMGLVLSVLMFAGVYSIRPLFTEIVRMGDANRAISERLRTISEEQQLLLEHSLDFIYRHDTRGVISYISPSVEHITGYSPQEWQGHYSQHYTDNPENQAGIDTTNDMLRTAKAGHSYKVEVKHKNGGVVWLEINKQPYVIDGYVAGFIGVARDVSRRVALEAEQEKLISELQDALAKVRTLRGLLPICSGCKKVRDDKGYWQQIEAYVSEHTEAEFSHGLCPDCVQRLYPEHRKPRT
ncbi:MAG: hypothetical protein A2010_15615 [Nitrospirae bacterium GWD2_57_9]|nr:MAG: hypothetical protein A2010_15615 [Nitrospirae bacterium GWD2_57_9]